MNKKTYVIAVLILVVDQVCKSLTEIFVGYNNSVKVIKNFFYLTVVHNTGGAWSILNNYNLIFIIISILAVFIIFKFRLSFQNNLRNNIAFACLYGGITSNLADRIFLGHVRDFLDFKIFGYNFPIFNVADMAIVIGVILLVVAIIKGEDKSDKGKSRSK